jgi:hypothetical protein
MRRRKEVVIPKGADFIRLRILRDELEIRIKWNRNYTLGSTVTGASGGWGPFIIILATLFNKTIIEVRVDYIKIDHGPIDLLPMVFYPSRMVKQLHVSLIRDERYRDADSAYGLYAELKSGKKELLIWDLKKTTLLFIEQEIERVLKIVDKG